MTPHAKLLRLGITADDYRTHVCQPGQTLINAGDIPCSLFYIRSGSVAVFLENSEGKQMVIALLNQGDFFGELGFFDPGSSRSASCRTRTNSVIYELDYPTVEKRLTGNPAFFHMLGQQMARRLRITAHKLGSLTLSDTSARVKQALLELSQQPDSEIDPEGVLINVSRSELGSLVNCTREMAGRVIRELQDKNLVAIKGRKLLVRIPLLLTGHQSFAARQQQQPSPPVCE